MTQYNPANNRTYAQEAGPTQSALDTAAAGTSGDRDDYSLGYLVNVQIPGSNAFFNLPQYAPIKGGKPTKRGWGGYSTSVAIPDLTAQQAIDQVRNLSGSALAAIQDKLYLGGYYGSVTPKYGIWDDTTLAAFRKMLIGLALNPKQASLGEYLDVVAKKGKEIGLAGAHQQKIIELSNPDDIRLTLLKASQDLYGGRLPEEDVEHFVGMWQSWETQKAMQGEDQTTAFEAGMYNPETGSARGAPASSGTWTTTAPPTAETYIRQEHPNQVAATEFGSAMDQMLAGLRRPG